MVVGQALRDSGIDLQTNTTLRSIDSLGGDWVRVNYESEVIRIQRIETKFSFRTLGRSPVSMALGLEEHGISLSESRAHIDKFFSTNLLGSHLCGGRLCRTS